MFVLIHDLFSLSLASTLFTRRNTGVFNDLKTLSCLRYYVSRVFSPAFFFCFSVHKRNSKTFQGRIGCWRCKIGLAIMLQLQYIFAHSSSSPFVYRRHMFSYHCTCKIIEFDEWKRWSCLFTYNQLFQVNFQRLFVNFITFLVYVNHELNFYNQ